MSDFKTRFKELRIASGMTQGDLAEKLRTSRSRIGMYETGKREPDHEMLEAIADLFNVDLDYLLGRSSKTTAIPIEKVYLAHQAGPPNIAAFTGSTGLRYSKRIPVLGRVAAGIPIEAQQEVLDWEEVTGEMALSGEYFGLQIRGDSMEPKFSSGDVIIVRQQDTAEDGNYVVALVNGSDAVCKRLKMYDDGIALVSTNPAYAPMYFTAKEIETRPVRILGVVKELRAKF